MCKRVCGCGRLIEYEGRGHPRRRCLKCAELHSGKPRCPCGKVVPSGGRYRYCSAECAKEAKRIQKGRAPKVNWRPDIPAVAAIEASHQRATRFALAWLRLRSGRPLTEGISSIWEGRTRLFEVRQSEIDFTVPKKGGYGNLPEWVMLDDEPRFLALYPSPAAYILLNSRRTAMLSTGAEPFKVAKMWEHKRMWVPRYNEWETVLLAPRRDCSIQALNLDGLPNPLDE